jgi:hypothetical protein
MRRPIMRRVAVPHYPYLQQCAGALGAWQTAWRRLAVGCARGAGCRRGGARHAETATSAALGAHHRAHEARCAAEVEGALRGAAEGVAGVLLAVVAGGARAR